ncbi:methyltransferase domain-containing protein [Candidatus Bathyarchaeota archaeon]|nr:methyltransferase domain-containing protein [Candidatus Bathyarchaeota archaeon]
MNMKEINWKERWREAYQQSSIGKARGNRDWIDFWNDKAEWFDEATLGDTKEPAILLEHVKIGPGMTVLDIGAGTGRFTIPLARIAKSVTAVEPSPKMNSRMKVHLDDQDISNVTIIAKKWQDVILGKDIGQHDVVIAPYSLAVEKMGDALEKINSATRHHACVMTWFKRTFWDYDHLWPILHGGEPFIPGPNYLYMVHILHDMGIYANVRVFFREKDKVFSSEDEIIEDLKSALYFTPSDEKSEKRVNKILRKHVREVTREEDGKILHHGTSMRVMVYWSKSPPST